MPEPSWQITYTVVTTYPKQWYLNEGGDEMSAEEVEAHEREHYMDSIPSTFMDNPIIQIEVVEVVEVHPQPVDGGVDAAL